MKKYVIFALILTMLLVVASCSNSVATTQQHAAIQQSSAIPENAKIFGNVLVIPEEGLWTYNENSSSVVEQNTLMIPGKISSFHKWRNYLFIAIDGQLVWTDTSIKNSVHFNTLIDSGCEDFTIRNDFLSASIKENGISYDITIYLPDERLEEIYQ